MGTLLFALFATVVGLGIWRKTAPALREERLRQRGYVRVDAPVPIERCFQARVLPGATEVWHFHQTAIAPFAAARAQGLAQYNRLTAIAWNRFVSGVASSDAYALRCQLCASAYERMGENLERDAIAAGTSPRAARVLREQCYDYAFPNPQIAIMQFAIVARMESFRVGR